ncbi:MAG TPA: phosphatase domain-containing protein, partial [Acidobacteriota bacterium]|nr:phosphatase domain-containing protein [Acidobacteriota bacterium]
HGFGSRKELYLKGRVLRENRVKRASGRESIWSNMLNMYRRFESDEIPGARVQAFFSSMRQDAVTDEEGYFEVRFSRLQQLDRSQIWHSILLKLPHRSGGNSVTAEGKVLIPPDTAQFGVISDIDDTVVKTDSTSLLRMVRTVFTANARTRIAFQGIAKFYAALQNGKTGHDLNPIFYVSSSPWNLHDLLIDFFAFQQIPLGPLMLRDWGLSEEQDLSTPQRSHKLKAITRIFDMYSHLDFVLIGDDAQEDPEIYLETVRLYRDRVRAVYIRNVVRDQERPKTVRDIANEVARAGSRMLLINETEQAAKDARDSGLIQSSISLE